MCEIVIESRTRVAENGHPVLYEKKYRGILDENSTFHLLAYTEKRMPLIGSQKAKTSEITNNLKSAA